MIVSEMIELLKEMPQDAEIGVKHDGYYADSSWEVLDKPFLKTNGKVQVCHCYCHP